MSLKKSWNKFLKFDSEVHNQPERTLKIAGAQVQLPAQHDCNRRNQSQAKATYEK